MNAPVSGRERQRHVRTATLLSGRLVAGEFSCGGEILNLSTGGARFRLDASPPRIDSVVFQCVDYPDLTGHVVWRAEREIGVEFDHESRDIAQRIQAETKPSRVSGEQRSTIRVSVLWSGRILCDDGAEYPCMVLNVSTEGARLRISIPAQRQDMEDVRLHVDRLGVLEGHVAWREADELAITFNEDPDRIADMLSAVLPRAQFAALADDGPADDSSAPD